MTDTPEEPPPQQAPPPAPPPAAPQAAPQAAPMSFGVPKLPWVPILVIAGIVVALVLGSFAWRSVSGVAPQEQTYAVEPFTPAEELITARERVEARDVPDASGRIVVVFGQGVTLNVNGRVQRGLGNDWLQVTWNEQTAFIRMQDAVTGSGAPPTPLVRERDEEEERVKEEEKPDEELDAEEEPQIVEAPPSGGTLSPGDVSWVRQPSARDFARYFPDDALDEGQSGNVTLSCIVGGSGRLACSVASESPSGYGFGNAAIGISRQLRVRTRLPDGSSAEGRELRLPLSFRAN